MAIDDQRMEVVNSNSRTFNVHHHHHDQFLRAIAQIILSISLFCIIFFHSSSSTSSSSRFSFLLRSIKFYLSAIPLHSLDKRWVFLICNGILAIVVNTSGLVNFPFFPSSTKFDHNHDYRFDHEDYHHQYIAASPVQVLLLENANQQAENEVMEKDEGPNEVEEDGPYHLQEEAEEEEEFEDKLCITAAEEEEYEKQIMEAGQEIRIDITGDDDEENERYDSDDGFDLPLLEEEEEDDEQEEEGMVLERMSTEELNQKFEDFIRKMKEDLRIEAQQQHLVAVN